MPGFRVANWHPHQCRVQTSVPIRKGVSGMRTKANDIGQHLVKLRVQRRLTQEQLAAKLQINGANMTRQVVANIEARRRRVYEHQIRPLVTVLRCSFDDLFLGTALPPKSNPSSHSKPPRR